MENGENGELRIEGGDRLHAVQAGGGRYFGYRTRFERSRKEEEEQGILGSRRRNVPNSLQEVKRGAIRAQSYVVMVAFIYPRPRASASTRTNSLVSSPAESLRISSKVFGFRYWSSSKME